MSTTTKTHPFLRNVRRHRHCHHRHCHHHCVSVCKRILAMPQRIFWGTLCSEYMGGGICFREARETQYTSAEWPIKKIYSFNL